MQLSINNQEGFSMLHPAKQLRADRPYLPMSGSQGGVLLAKAIACAQHVDNVICRSQARLASRWASRRLTSADLRRRRLERAQSALAALAELRTLEDSGDESSGDARQAFEASFKQPLISLRKKEVLRHLRGLDRLDVQARYLAARRGKAISWPFGLQAWFLALTSNGFR
jgi:hypothetical protein